MTSPVRRYCFTVNNPTLSGDATLKELEELTNFRFTIFQKELAPTTGTPHYQGYVEFTNNTRITTIQNRTTDNFHCTPARGSRSQNVTYCSKPDTHVEGPWTSGTSTQQGTRTDLTGLANMAMTATSLREVIAFDPAGFCRYSRGLQTIHTTFRAARTTAPTVVLLYGPPGTGKTRHIMDNYDHENVYVKQTDDRFFDGYEGQDVFLLDDFAGRASKMSLKFCLMLLDRYPVALPVKGSTVSLLATKIYITTNVHPNVWYDYTNRSGQYECISRRIHQVFWYPKTGPPIPVTKHSFFDRWSEHCVEENVFVPLVAEAPGNQEEADLSETLGSQDTPISID